MIALDKLARYTDLLKGYPAVGFGKEAPRVGKSSRSYNKDAFGTRNLYMRHIHVEVPLPGSRLPRSSANTVASACRQTGWPIPYARAIRPQSNMEFTGLRAAVTYSAVLIAI